MNLTGVYHFITYPTNSTSMFTNQSILIDDLPQFEKVSFHTISRKYLTKCLLQIAGYFVGLLIFFGVYYYFSTTYFYVLWTFIGLSLFLLFKSWDAFKRQPKYGFALREKDILYRRGFLNHKVTVVPFSRIQHVSVTHGVLDKPLNIANLNIFTAGGVGSDIRIPGLSLELAEQLKEAVSQKISSYANE